MEIMETCCCQGVLDEAQEQRAWEVLFASQGAPGGELERHGSSRRRALPFPPRQHSQGAQTGGEARQQQLCQLKETSGSGEFPHVFPMCFLCILLLICHADQKRWRDSNYFTQNLTLQAGCSPKA